MKRNSHLLCCVLFLVGAGFLPAAELHVRGLNWFGNRNAEQQLKLLLGEQPGATLDAGALENAALVLISALNDEGFLEPGLIVELPRPNGGVARYPLDAQLEHPLPRRCRSPPPPSRLNAAGASLCGKSPFLACSP